jgi:uncharacterized membrane protein
MHYIDFCVQNQFNLANGISATGDKVSPHVQHLATKELYEMIKPPEESVLTIKQKADDKVLEQQKDMAMTIRQLVENQKMAIEQGHKITDVQKIFHKSNDDVVEVDYE